MAKPIVEAAIRSLLFRARIMWAALLLVPTFFLGAMIWLVNQETFQPTMEATGILIASGWGAAIFLPFIGLVVRGILGRTTEGQRADIVIQKWFGGQIVAWAMAEGAALIAIVLMFLTGSMGSFLGPALVALTFQALLYPRRV